MNTLLENRIKWCLWLSIAVILCMAGFSEGALVGHWTFDEPAGSTTAIDAIGGTDGLISGDVATGVEGVIGNAYEFSGSGYVDMGNAAFISSVTGGSVSFSYWVKALDNGTGRNVAIFLGNDTVNDRYIDTGIENSDLIYGRDRRFSISDILSPSAYNDGQWHHVVFVIDADAGHSLYVDGSLVDSDTASRQLTSGINNFEIGRLGRSSATDYFRGVIDDVQIYDEALDAQEVVNIYALGLGDVAADPLPAGSSVNPATTTLSWVAPSDYTPEVGYNLVFRKATEATEPNFAASDNIIEITNATATSPTTVSLDYDAIYYWRVDSYEPNGIASDASDDILHPGVVWSFSTLPSVPIITAQPSDAAAAVGESAELVLEYTCTSPVTSAVWEYASNIDPNWVAAGGASVIDESGTPKTVTQTIPGVAVADEGLYRCTISNDGGSEVSETAGLAVKRLLAHYEFEGNANDTNAGDGIKNDGVAMVWGNESATPDVTYAATGLPGLGDGVVFNANTDETDPNQSYIQLPITAYPNSDVGGGLEAGMITCWIKPKTTGTIMGTFNDGLNTAMQLSVQNTTSLRIYKRNDFHDENNVYFSPSNPPDGDTWYFAAATWGDANGQLRTYIAPSTGNGYIEDIVNDIPDYYASWQYAPTIGGANSRGTINSFFMAGSMLDDLKIYNYALTPEQVAAEFNAVTGNTLCIVTSFDGDYYDTNNDCVVDMTDFADFAAAWLATGLYLP